MKYILETVINAPLDKVIELYDNPDNLKEWLPGLESFEHISGNQGMEGAKSKLTFEMNGRKLVMIETITKRNLPDEFSSTYEADGVFSITKNHFSKVDDNTTMYISENEFKFTNLMMKVIGFIMPATFRKTSEEYMQNFKKFVENHA